MMRRRAVLQATPTSWTVHPEPLATTEERATLRTAAAAFMADVSTNRHPTFRTGFYWCGEDGGIFEPGSRLTIDECLALAKEASSNDR